MFACTARRCAAPLAVLVAALGLSACAHDALDYLPPADRSLLEAQARLGVGGHEGPARPVSVDEMLNRVRTGAKGPQGGITSVPDDAAPAVAKLRFADGQATIDDSMSQEIARVSAAAGQGGVVTVVAKRPGTGSGASFESLGRAGAVARQASHDGATPVMKFDSDVSPAEVILVSGTVPDAPDPGGTP